MCSVTLFAEQEVMAIICICDSLGDCKKHLFLLDKKGGTERSEMCQGKRRPAKWQNEVKAKTPNSTDVLYLFDK